MKKSTLTLCLLATFACGMETSSAQDKDKNLIQELDQQLKAIDERQDELSKAEVDVSGVLPENDYRQLTSYTDDRGKVLKSTNRIEGDDGGVMTESYYFDDKGELKVALTTSYSFGDQGSHFYVDETYYFKSKQLVAIRSREGNFADGEKFDESKVHGNLVPTSETDIPKRETYEYHRKRAETSERLVRAFSGEHEEAIVPAHALLESISPNARYLVSWSRADDDVANFFLIDLESGKRIGDLTSGLSPVNTNVDYWAEWSGDSTHLAFGFDARWSSMGGELFAISPEKVKSLGDLHESTGRLALLHLKKKNHPYTTDDIATSVHGFINILSVENDGRVHLVLSTQSKSEDLDENFDTEMTVALTGDGSARASGVRLLKPGGDPTEFAADSEGSEAPRAKPTNTKPEANDTGFIITARRIGAITPDTAFNLKAVRKLFPKHQVVADKETFEEGGEQPVIRVFSGGKPALTLVPVPDTADLNYVYTTHSGVSTQLGFAVGDRFGEMFEANPEHAYHEGISGEVITQAPGIENVSFRFWPEQGNPDGDELPAYEKLKTWKLQSIEWSPAK